MRTRLLVTIVALLASAGYASAGGVADGGGNYLTSSSQSSSNANSASDAVAIAQGGSVTFNNPGNVNQRISGTQTIKSAPSIAPPSMSSGHPCAYAPVSVGVSVIGFGGAFGGQKIDDACLLAQMGVSDASIVMIAMRNKNACRALASVGRISPDSCGGSRRNTVNVGYAAPAKQRVQRVQKQQKVVRASSKAKPVGRQLSGNCRMVPATAGTTKKICS